MSTLFNDRREYEELHPQQEELATLLISRLQGIGLEDKAALAALCP